MHFFPHIFILFSVKISLEKAYIELYHDEIEEMIPEFEINESGSNNLMVLNETLKCPRCRNHGQDSLLNGHMRECLYRLCECSICKLIEGHKVYMDKKFPICKQQKVKKTSIDSVRTVSTQTDSLILPQTSLFDDRKFVFFSVEKFCFNLLFLTIFSFEELLFD